MQAILALVTIGVALLGIVYAVIPRKEEGSRWQALRAAGLLPVWIVAALALAGLIYATAPSAPPFAAGMHLGWGLLIGGVLGLYALLESCGTVDGTGWARRMVGLLSAAALGPALAVWRFKMDPTDVLNGCALGALLVTALAFGVVRLRGAQDEPDAAPGVAHGLELYALAATLTAVAARLAIEHVFPKAATSALAAGYWTLPSLLLAGAAFFTIVLAHNWSGAARRWLLLASGVVAAGVMTAIAAALQVKLLPGVAWQVLGFGLVAVAVTLAALLQEERGTDEEAPLTALAFGAVLVMLALGAGAFLFHQMHGFGEALAALAALPLIAALSLGRDRLRPALTASLGVGLGTLLALLALYRLFLETVGRGTNLDFQSQYNLIALILGAGLAWGVQAYLSRSRGSKAPGVAVAIFRMAVLGLALGVAPLALLTLWGVKGLGAFLAGVVISEVTWVLQSAWATGSNRRQALAAAPHPYLLTTMLLAIQFAPLLLKVHLTRAQVLAVTAALVGVVVLWVIIDAFTRKAAPVEETSTVPVA